MQPITDPAPIDPPDHLTSLPASTPDAPAPTPGADRIGSIDVLRGVAVLGIFVMNLPTFAFSAQAYLIPHLAGGFEGVNYFTWLFSHLFFDQKMMSIFSMLFGAGIVVFADRAMEKRHRAAGLFYRRLFWLWLIGMLHAYLIWEGDILVFYATSGAVVYLLRKLRPRWLILISVALLTIGMAVNTVTGFFFDYTRSMHEQRLALIERGEPVPYSVESFAEAWTGIIDNESGEVVEEGIREMIAPSPEFLEKERNAVLGSFLDRAAHRAPEVLAFQTFLYLIWGFWRVCAMMLLGMALYKLGIFSAARSTSFYTRMGVICLGIGLPFMALSAHMLHRADFDLALWFFYTGHFNYIGSALLALAYTAIVMLICKSGALTPVTSALASVGRMAFTNYLMQSMIAAIAFFGWGFGLYASLERAELIPVVLGMWFFQIVFSIWWLRRFRFGPMEWLWRSLTYWRVQPMRRTDIA